MLNSMLDPTLIGDEFRKNNRILIRNALQPDIAEKLLHSLETEIPWHTGYMDKGVPHVLSPQQLANFSADQLSHAKKKITSLGNQGFQFCYSHYSISDHSNMEECHPNGYINTFRDYLYSDSFFRFVQTVTGATETCKLEILAARYTAGDFLMMHSDTAKPERRIAFVFNLSRDWHVDWGGLTHFIERDGTVSETFVPTYNSLLIFSVPMLHSVSCVMPYVRRSRYSVTGWLTV